MKAQSGELVVKGFSSTGIHPFNSQIFNDHDFLASEEVEAPIESVENYNQVSVSPIHNQLPEPQQNIDIEEPISFEPSTSSGARSSSFILPQEISPIPVRIKKTTNRGRKPGKAEIISSSPYKQALEESLKKIKGKKHVKKSKLKPEKCNKKGKTLKNKKNYQHEDETSSSESENLILSDSPDLSSDRSNQEDAKCIYCSCLFSDDKGGESWLQCVVCTMWAHELCSGNEKEYFICEFCCS